MKIPAHRPGRQSGVALAVALILLVVLTLLALSGVRMSTMELRMAVGDELRVNAFQQAQSLVDGTIRMFSNTPVLAPGVEICAAKIEEAATDTKCTAAEDIRVQLPEPYATYANSGLMNVVIRRVPPQNAEPPPGAGFSVNLFDAAYVQVEGRYDETATGRGKVDIYEGVAIVYGASGELTFGSAQETALFDNQ